MEKQKVSVNGFSSKSSQSGGQQKQLPYSVETPYGFHLDLDFLKYVDDIEKGNTIKKLPIQRRRKGPKFSTLPRNFSLPANSHQSTPQRDVWAYASSLRPTGKTQEIQQIFDFKASDSESTACPRGQGFRHTSKMSAADMSIRAFDEQPMGFHVRPHLLRASSMPATVLQRKNSELEDEEPQAGRESAEEKGSSENVFCSGTAGDKWSSTKHSLQKQLSEALKRIRELEEEVHTIPQLKTQICALKEEKERCLLGASQEVAYGKPNLEDYQQLVLEVKEPSNNEDLDTKQDINLQCSDSMQISRMQAGTSVKSHSIEESKQSEEKPDNLSIIEQDEEAGKRLNKPDVNVSAVQQNMTTASQLHGNDKELPSIAALQEKLVNLEKRFAEASKELERVNALLREQVMENRIMKKKLQQKSLINIEETKRDQMSGDSAEAKTSSDYVCTHDASVSANSGNNVLFEREVSGKGEMYLSSTHVNEQLKDLRTTGTQTDLAETQDAEVLANVPTAEKLVEAIVSTCNTAAGTDSPWASPTGPAAGNPLHLVSETNGGCLLEDRFPGHGEEPCLQGEEGAAAKETSISCCVSRIQELLQEQWACLPSRPAGSIPGTARDPSSTLSSIQAQLVSTVNTLSSLCSPKGQKQGPVQEGGLKSIMKKSGSAERLGNGGAKKNLKFVGVNGGYETTSSEDSSEDDNMEVGAFVPQEQKEDRGHHEQRAEEAAEADGSAGTAEPNVRSKTKKTARKVVDEEFIAACHLLKDRLEEVDSPNKEMRHVLTTLYQEWFRVTSRRDSQADTLALYLSTVGEATPTLLHFVVNLADGNGNTALHYSVSHSNFHIVELLLDTGLCEVDRQNQAGYTAIMLASLAVTDSPEDMGVAKQLIGQGNVNAQATQGGQTALALAASHGRTAMVRLLLDCGAEPDARDHSGSTALMCACEHGHTEIVRLLLECPHCDASLGDRDGNTALSVATQASHSEIVDLLQAHVASRPVTSGSRSEQPVPSHPSG